MKRLFVILLILAMLLPMSVIAEDSEPIVGQWYWLFDAAATPEFATEFAPYERIIGIYSFLENGTVMCLELDVQNGTGTPAYSAAGKWEKKDSGYQYSILGLGEGIAMVEDDCIYLSLPQVEGISVRLRKLIPFNYYQDYVFI